MILDNNTKHGLQILMTSPHWGCLETAYKLYLAELFPTDVSVKRDNEFETIWQLAFAEGGKDHIQRFWYYLDNQAKNYTPNA
jgi:hypothetical protein